MSVLRWGIVGTGRIARHFASDLAITAGSTLVAVGSRSRATADAFGTTFAVAHRHGSYEDLVTNPAVDVVYVATPHPMHVSNCLLALDAGKAVVCEKPFTMDAAEAERVVAQAREKNLFCMEGMWSRFFPATQRLRGWLADGRIGEPRFVSAAFGFRGANDPADRLLNRELGGGAVLDVGVYPVALTSMILGAPIAIAAEAHIGVTGVDEQTSMSLRWKGGALASLGCAVRTRLPTHAVIDGTRGRIQVGPSFWRPRTLTYWPSPDSDAATQTASRMSQQARRLRDVLERSGPIGARAAQLGGRLVGWAREQLPVENSRHPYVGHGFHHEIVEVARCLRAGLTESPLMPLDESIAIMRTLDEVRRQISTAGPPP